MSALTDWLDAHGFSEHARLFIDNDVDFTTLLLLTDNDLKELGLSFGARKRLLGALAEAKALKPEPAVRAEERRQLTVMFCDMVGFTGLAQRVDPEVLKDIVRAYEDACAACIARYEGYLFQRLGDGIIAFFGFPLAHEREAERAIRAGLDILDAMACFKTPDTAKLEVRIGIATGIVVVSADGRTAVSETMNLAARLQSVAEPGTIAVSSKVRKLAADVFGYADIGAQSLKGITLPVQVYRVAGVATAEDRQAKDKPLIGRGPEMEALLDKWRRVHDAGEGFTINLCGEPGIGKSRIADALCASLEHEHAQIWRFQCSPFHLNSAFYPIRTHLDEVLQIGDDSPADARLDKLEALIVGRYGLPRSDVRFIASMMSIPCEERYGALDISPRLAKQETVRVMEDMVAAAARLRPTLLLFEDMHWADPTTLETLERLIGKLAGIPLLIVATYRPEFEPHWSRHVNVAVLNLAKLTAEQSSEMVSRLAEGKSLPAEIVEQIIAKTDGVPLFVEELTRTILESGGLVEAGGRYVYTGPTLGFAIPETLRDSLAARLDRLAKAKPVAQIGSVVGRTFSHELISALAQMDEAALAEGLAELTASGLAMSSGVSPGPVSYTFKHALVQDVAYDSLLRSQRKPLHARIAQVLEERHPETREREPELLAHHYSAADDQAAAAPLWLKAGEVAMRRFAVPEADSHLRKGMELLATSSPSAERDLLELRFRAALGPALVAGRGWGHPELSAVMEPAWSLARRLTHRQGYLPILNALWVHCLCTDRLDVSMHWAEKLLEVGAETQDDNLVIVGHRAVSGSAFWQGRFDVAKAHGDKLHALYDAGKHWHIAQLTNTDPLTGESIYRAQYLWIIGYPDQAVAASDARDDHARRRNHPFDLAFSLTLGAQAFDFLSQPEELLARAAEADNVGRRFGVSLFFEVMAEISQGIAWLRAGRHADSATRLDRAITRLAATGHRIWIAYLRALQAEALALGGNVEAAEALLDESIARIEGGEERCHYAEVLRLKGWLLARQGRRAEAEKRLGAALAVARAQGAKSWELRATTTLARLLAEEGEEARAFDMLQAIYGWFTEGFNTRDLTDARALLDELGLQLRRGVKHG
ncbi:adenylate/guanylate cyclase domain-containing protein [Taklimakanibacter deserti]|uniref:adenylate/guanylate cyclase domain-containing protein n=1 Tax=Taklimakanibacter deserti TaxID=2267839 RepID=UPI000E65A8D7